MGDNLHFDRMFWRSTAARRPVRPMFETQDGRPILFSTYGEGLEQERREAAQDDPWRDLGGEG